MRTQPLSDAERRANRKSIESIPRDLLPDGCLPRCALGVLASAGHEVYAYASGGETHGTWCIWWQELADSRGDRDGRLTIAQWCEQWHDLITGDAAMHRQPEQPEQPEPTGGVA